LAILAALHIHPSDPELPIPEHVVMACVVLVLVTLLALLLRSRLSVEKPGAMQQVAEILLTNPLGFGIKDLLEENIHHGAAKLIPFVVPFPYSSCSPICSAFFRCLLRQPGRFRSLLHARFSLSCTSIGRASSTTGPSDI